MNEPKLARAVLLWGSSASLVVLLLFPFLPERFPRFLFPLALAWVVRLLIERKQFSKERIARSNGFRFHSNGRVVGVSLLGALIYLLLAVGVITLYFMLGFLSVE